MPEKVPNLADLQTNVKSLILRRIADNFRANVELQSKTQYTKSDGTNYGMYTKADELTSLTDIWERVFPVNPAVITSQQPQGPIKGGG